MISILQKILQFKNVLTSEKKENDREQDASNVTKISAEHYSKDYLEDFLGPNTKGPHTNEELALMTGNVVSSLTTTHSFFAATTIVGTTALRAAVYLNYRI